MKMNIYLRNLLNPIFIMLAYVENIIFTSYLAYFNLIPPR